MSEIKLMLGDCMVSLKELPDNSVDSIITDPPYHLTTVKRFGKENSAPAKYGKDGAFVRASKGFMNKEWDGGDISFQENTWKECLRVLKPGGHLLSFGGSRTYHRMAVAIEDAGFEIRDQLMWLYGNGFPKSHNIGKAIDKLEGNEREFVGEKKQRGSTKEVSCKQFNICKNPTEILTKGNSKFEGWGSALKPAHEPIVLARKPLSEKSIAENAAKWGTGGINIDDSRIETDDILGKKVNENDLGIAGWAMKDGRKTKTTNKLIGTFKDNSKGLGRFPANIMLDEEAGKLLDEQSKVGASKFFYTAKT